MPSYVTLPRLLNPHATLWNEEASKTKTVTDTIQIKLPIEPDDLAAADDDYVMYAAYYVREHCPEQLKPGDVEFQTHYMQAVIAYQVVASINNKAIGRYQVQHLTEKDSGPAFEDAHRMMVRDLERAYSDRRTHILQSALDRHAKKSP